MSIHYVGPKQYAGGQFACGLWSLEHLGQRVTIEKQRVTCRKCRRVLGLKPKRDRVSGVAAARRRKG